MTVHFLHAINIDGTPVFYYRGDNIDYASGTWRGDGIIITLSDSRIFVPASSISYVKENR